MAAADANASAEAKVEELRGQARAAFELHQVAFEATGIRVATLEAELAKLGQCAVHMRQAIETVDANAREQAEQTGRRDGTPRTS